MKKRVSTLQPDDLVDLEGDVIADPGYDPDNLLASQHPEWHFEYERVDEVVFETADCAVVNFSSGAEIGFPPDHEVEVAP